MSRLFFRPNKEANRMAELLMAIGAVGIVILAAHSVYQSYKEAKRESEKKQIVVYRARRQDNKGGK